MQNQPLKILALPLLTSALCFTACGKKSVTPEQASSEPEKITIPEAPDAAIDYILSELASSNGEVLWVAMPESYQNDVNSIAQLAGTKIDAEIYDKIYVTVNRTAKVLDKQKEFVFNSELLGAQAGEEQSSELRTAWPSIMKLIDTLTTSSLASASGLQNFEGEAFFEDTVSDILADMDALTKLESGSNQLQLSDLDKAEVKYLEGTETTAMLEVTMPDGQVETETFVKVEDRWVPQDLAQNWEAQTAETRSTLEAIDPTKLEKQKPQILSVFAMMEGILNQVEAAETQEQFDQALQGAMMPMMGLMMMGQGMGGGAAPAMPGGNQEVPEIPEGMPNLPSAP